MKRVISWLVLCAAVSLYGQPQSISLSQPAPPAVSHVTAAPTTASVGVAGTTYYYWVIARYPVGASAQTGPAVSTSSPTTLSAANSVLVSWTPVQGATGYDVLRSTQNSYPGSCTACAVVLNTAASSVTDTGGALLAYPPGGVVQASLATASIALNNQDATTPFLATQVNSQTGRLGVVTGPLVVGKCPLVQTDGTLSGNGDCLTTASGAVQGAANLTTVGRLVKVAGAGTVTEDSALTVAAGILTATGFSGPLTGNVTGNASGSAGTVTSISGHASTELSDTTALVRGAAALDTAGYVLINGATAGSATIDKTGGPFWDSTNKQLVAGSSSAIGPWFGGLGQLHARKEAGAADIRISTAAASSNGYLAFDRARGTFGTPTGIKADDIFGSIVGVGFDGVSAGMTHGPEMQMFTLEDWDATHLGSGWKIYGIPKGTATQKLAVTIDPTLAGNGNVQSKITSSGARTTGLLLYNNATAQNTAISIDFNPGGNINFPLARINALRATAGNGDTDTIFSQWDGSNLLERMRILGLNGNVGFGTTTPLTVLHALTATATSPNGILSQKVGTDTNGAVFDWYASHGTGASPTTLLTGEGIGKLWGFGHDGTGFISAGGITLETTGTVTTNRVPSALKLWTCTDASPSVCGVALTLGADKSATFAGQINANAVNSNIRLKADGTGAKDGFIGANSLGVLTIGHWDGPSIFYDVNGALSFSGVTSSFPSIIKGTINGFAIQSAAGTLTYNDAVTAGSGTVALRNIFKIDTPTLTATNSSVTYTLATALHLGLPVASTNVTIGTALSLIADGPVQIGGGSATKIACFKADGKTLGYATMLAGDISACN